MIQFCVKLGYKTTKTYKNVRKVLDASAVPCATTFRWHRLFTSGKESIKDEERRGRPTITKTFENIAQVEQVSKNDF